MQWTITDNLAMEVTELETLVGENDHQPMFEFKNDKGERYGVQLTHAGIKFGTWNDEGEWVEFNAEL